MRASIQRNSAKLGSILGLQHQVVRILQDVEAVVVGPREYGRSAAHRYASCTHPDISRSICVHDSSAMTVWLDIVAVTDRSGSGDRKSTRLNSSHRCISYA